MSQFHASNPFLETHVQRDQPRHAADTDSEIIDIRCGERVFTTTRRTLVAESIFFRDMLSDPFCGPQLSDGTWFVDVDPVIFSYVLRYLRSGIFPVIFSASEGHDFATYMEIEQLARHLGILTLEVWLSLRYYENAILINNNAFPDRLPFATRDGDLEHRRTPSNVQTQIHFTAQDHQAQPHSVFGKNKKGETTGSTVWLTTQQYVLRHWAWSVEGVKDEPTFQERMKRISGMHAV